MTEPEKDGVHIKVSPVMKYALLFVLAIPAHAQQYSLGISAAGVYSDSAFASAGIDALAAWGPLVSTVGMEISTALDVTGSVDLNMMTYGRGRNAALVGAGYRREGFYVNVVYVRTVGERFGWVAKTQMGRGFARAGIGFLFGL